MANSGKVTAWLAAQGWTFTEMTEAQKFEMRLTLNICGYATSGSKWTRPCARAPERRRRSAGVVGLLRHEAGGLE